MAKKSRGWMVMTIAGQRTVREREYDAEECEGCHRRDKPVYTYLGRNGEPIVCSKRCFELAMVVRFGGPRKPSRAQVRQTNIARKTSVERKTTNLKLLPPIAV